jgi:outer membrane protein
LTRAADESVPQALSGYRPKVDRHRRMLAIPTRNRMPPGSATARMIIGPRGLSVTLDQVLYNGGRTGNLVRGAESRVLGARETLRNTEQTILLNAATSYMNVLRDTALLNLRRNNIEVLTTQLKQTSDRFRVGEVTRTDVAQSESRLAKARSDAFLAESNLKTSIATYQQIVGDARRTKLAPAKSVEGLLPKIARCGAGLSQREHPAIIASLHGVDQQQLQVKTIEGELYPSLDPVGPARAATKRQRRGQTSGRARWSVA